MPDVRQMLDDYAHSYADPDGECAHDCDDHRGKQAPKAFAALRAVLDRHPLVHDEIDRCRGCWNAIHDNYERWPCDTVRAITAALEAEATHG